MGGRQLRPPDLAPAAGHAIPGRDTGCDTLVSCFASRTGASADAWSVDHRATVAALAAAARAGLRHVVLLSAILVHKPLLAFQPIKLTAEQA